MNMTLFSSLYLLLLTTALVSTDAQSVAPPSLETLSGVSSYEETLLGYTHQKTLAPSVKIFWTVQGDELQLAVLAAAKSWVAFGLSDSGAMRGADMVIFEVAKDAADDSTMTPTVSLNDYYSLDFVRPQLDDCPSDWNLINHVVEDEWIAFEATRLLKTGDSQDFELKDDAALVVQPTVVIAAWGDDSNGLSYHGPDRAIRSSLRFFAEPASSVNQRQQLVPTTPASSADVLKATADGSFRLKANNYTIPTDETTYHLACMDVAKVTSDLGLPDQIHFIGIVHSPSMENNGIDTSRNVHHFTVIGRNLPCGAVLRERKAFYGWARGQEALVFPPDVSVPIGGGSGYQSLLLDIHYDNRDGTPGIVDDTGVDIYYVKEPTKHAAEIMVYGGARIGLDGRPVGQGKTVHEMLCPSACSVEHFPQPVTIFAEGLHMHASGERTVGQLIRNGSVVHEATVEVWDFNQNGFRLVQQNPYQLLPGDEYKMTCYYQNAGNSTRFGLGSQDEMCMSFLFYYPAGGRTISYCGPFFPFVPNCSASYETGSLEVDDNYGRYFGPSPSSCPMKQDVSEGIDLAPTVAPISTEKPSSGSYRLETGGFMILPYLLWYLVFK